MHAVPLATPDYAAKNTPQPLWRGIMDELSATAYRTYHRFIYESPETLLYWQQATPIGETPLTADWLPGRRAASLVTLPGCGLSPGSLADAEPPWLPGWYRVGQRPGSLRHHR